MSNGLHEVGARRVAMFAVNLPLLAIAIAIGALSAGQDHWDVAGLLVIATLASVSELTAIRHEGTAWISGSFLGIVLAAVLYGSAPAAAIGVLTVCIGWLRSRESLASFTGNVVNYAWFPLVAGLSFHALVSVTGAGSRSPVYFLCVFAVFVIALAVNVLAVTIPQNTSLRSLGEMIVAIVTPLLAAELVSALLTMAAADVAIRLHVAGIVMFGLVLIIFQYLIGELLTSRRRDATLQRVATTDALTGLANRERFRGAVDARVATGASFAVLLMDLDRFKEINDTLGHMYGDALLRDLGPRLVAAVGGDDLVARLGGDEFAILLTGAQANAFRLENAVGRLLAIVSEPFAVDELSLEVGASIGVARYPEDGADSHALLRCADIAMYAAKEAQVGWKLYQAEQNEHSARRLNVLSEIRRALGAGEIVVHYQPIVDLEHRRVIGAEALVRWQHPEQGLIAPGVWVPTVEQTGLIGPLTRHVLEQSIAQCAAWRAAGHELSVAVNLSVRNLLDRELPGSIEAMLAEHGVPASALQLEITESMIMSDPERALSTVGRLTQLGVRLSVDDFGTGYSSLANLRRLPIDELKIDRSFVSPMLQDESDMIIVRSTINLGHDLGLRIIAEGVEDRQTLEHLAELGCDLAQGFHLSRPLPEAAFTRWLEEFEQAPPVRPALEAVASRAGLIAAAPEL